MTETDVFYFGRLMPLKFALSLPLYCLPVWKLKHKLLRVENVNLHTRQKAALVN